MPTWTSESRHALFGEQHLDRRPCRRGCGSVVVPDGKSTSRRSSRSSPAPRRYSSRRSATDGRTVVALADAALEVDVGGGHDRHRDGEDQRRGDQPARAAADERRDDQHDADGQHDRPTRRCRAPNATRRGGAEAEHDGAGDRRARSREALTARESTSPPAARQMSTPIAASTISGLRKKAAGNANGNATQRDDRRRATTSSVRARPSSSRGPVGRHEEREQQVEQQAGPAEQREHDEADAEQQRVEVEVAAEAGGDADDHAVVGRAASGDAEESAGGGGISVMGQASTRAASLPIGNVPQGPRDP